jgi:hypothetical protein
MRKLLLLASFLIILVLAFAPVNAQESTAYVRIAHFGVNVGEVDIYINGDLRSIGRNVEYGTATGWMVVSADTFEIAVTPEGRSLSAAIIEPTTLTLEPGSRTTIAILGNTQTTGVDAHLIEEDYSNLGEFQSRVTVLHAIPETEAIDLWLDGELFRGRLAFPGSLTLIDGGSNDGVTTFDALEGTYDISILPNGLEGEALIDLSDTALAAQTFYLIVAALDADGNPTAVVFPQTAN